MNNSIDIIIPCLKQDLNLLTLCIQGIRLNIKDTINKIYIVSPNDIDIINFCHNNNLVFVNETTLFEFTIKDINKFRPGWIFQQLIKLHGGIGECENYLCIDADHILLKSHKFVNENNSYNFYYASEYHIPYFNSIKDMFKGKYDKSFEHSFISDKMIFNKQKLSEFKQELENLNDNEYWYDVILNHYDVNNFSFSEFETYGTWLYNNYKELINPIECNRCMSYQKIENLDYITIKNNYNNFSSITQHKFAS